MPMPKQTPLNTYKQTNTKKTNEQNYWSSISQCNYSYNVNHNFMKEENKSNREEEFDEVRPFHDPWNDYYRQLEIEHNETNNLQQTMEMASDNDNENDNQISPVADIGNEAYLPKSECSSIANEINSCEAVEIKPGDCSRDLLERSDIIEITSGVTQTSHAENEANNNTSICQVNHTHVQTDSHVEVLQKHHSFAINCTSTTHTDDTIETDNNIDAHIVTNDIVQSGQGEEVNGISYWCRHIQRIFFITLTTYFLCQFCITRCFCYILLEITVDSM